MKLGDMVKIVYKTDKFNGHTGKIVKIVADKLTDTDGIVKPVERYLLEGSTLDGAAASDIHTFKDAITGKLVEIPVTKKLDRHRWQYDFMVKEVL